MVTPITTQDNIFDDVRAALTKASPTFLSDVVNLINRSPSLVAEIRQVDAYAFEPLQGGQKFYTHIETPPGANTLVETAFESQSIEIPALSSYQDKVPIYSGGSLGTGKSDAITAAGAYVGMLAHQLGQWADPGIGPFFSGYTNAPVSLLGSYPIEQLVATELASEGKAAYSEYLAKSQIEATETHTPLPSTLGNGKILFTASNSATNDTVLLHQVSKLTSAPAAISTLASQYWSTHYQGSTYLASDWRQYSGGDNPYDPSAFSFSLIDPSIVSAFSVQVSASGIVTGAAVQTNDHGTLTKYALSFNGVGIESAKVYNAQGVLLYKQAMDLSKYYYLSEFSVGFGGNNQTVRQIDGEYLQVTGNSDTVSSYAYGPTGTLVTGNSNVIDMMVGSVTVSGNGNAIVPIGNGDGDPIIAMVTGNNNVIGLESPGGSATVTGSGNIINAGGSENDTNFQPSYTVKSVSGHSLINAGNGNATLLGGTAGDTFKLTGGSDLVTFGGGSSLLSTGSGTATITGGGADTIVGGSGGADFFIAGVGSAEVIHGYRVGVDDISTNGQAIKQISVGHGGTLITLSSGATINLIGVYNANPLFS